MPESVALAALVVSVGRIANTSDRYTLEIMQFQPVIEAPEATELPPTGTLEVLGSGALPANEGLQMLTLSKAMPADDVRTVFGYLEVWANFRHRAYYVYGNEWSATSLAAERPESGKRAAVTLPELMLPRVTIISSLNAPITTVPFVWVYVRHP